MRVPSILAALAVMAGCAHAIRPRSVPAPLPASIVGDFIDDYGIRYSITSAEWFQRPRARYRIHRVDTIAGFLIAQNGGDNPSDKGMWSRIDWVALPSMAPFGWAFCLSAYDALTSEAAEAITVARKETPRTGCNGHPFSRMRRAMPADTLKSAAYDKP